MTTGYVWDERFAWHDTGRSAGFVAPSLTVQPHSHFENAESKARLASLVEVSGLAGHLSHKQVEPATMDDLLRVHDAAYVDHISTSSAQLRGGDTGDIGTPFGHGGFEFALLAAGGVITATRAVVDGEASNAYALVRPPGHHATRDAGSGFCIFANIAIGIEWARRERGVGRIAVVDWDVHHGNGTQSIYFEDRDVLTVSVHQDNYYPFGSGGLDERGNGQAFGAALNVPLPAGSGNGAYRSAMEDVIAPALRQFKPDLIVVACGFDASVYDPLGRMMVTASGFAALTAVLLDVAQEVCEGRLVMSHEGGYSPIYVPYCGLAVLEQMSGVVTGVGDAFALDLESLPDQQLQPHQQAVINAAATLVGEVPTA
jgi:acetoin utilization deacetylase AcuC-like enzyme